MNNRGFTLIELLVTIVLLGVISIISYVSVHRVILESQNNNCKNLITSIQNATKEYVSDKRYDSTFANGTYEKRITAAMLTNNKYLSLPIVSPYDRKTELMPSKIDIKIDLNNDYTIDTITISSRDYTYLPDCNKN